MSLRHRAMQPEDIHECVKIVAADPIIGPRYGATIQHLPAAWLRLLSCEAKSAIVFYEEEGSRAPICFFGTTAFVRDEFLCEMKAPPHFWVGPELARRIISGESPVLTDKQLRDANSEDGLNMVCWESRVRAGYEAHTELHRYVMSVFIQAHRGYLWKEVIADQPESPDRLRYFLRTGAAVWDPLISGYAYTLRKELGEMVSNPHVVGVSREAELNRRGDWAGSWIGALFDYHPPKLRLSRGEQRLLSAALIGATDEHLASMLKTSLHAVKKVWVSVYHRVEDQLPALIPDAFRSDPLVSSRGREKRRGLLAYLREHPEELRPISRKLLAKAAGT